MIAHDRFEKRRCLATKSNFSPRVDGLVEIKEPFTAIRLDNAGFSSVLWLLCNSRLASLIDGAFCSELKIS